MFDRVLRPVFLKIHMFGRVLSPVFKRAIAVGQCIESCVRQGYRYMTAF